VVTQTSDLRPDASEIERLLPRFTGEIMQVPPAYSAIKINGERAYDLARDGEKFEIAPRPVTIHSLRRTGGDRDHAVLEAECGKGTYVRAIARDLGRALGCYGHVIELRRTRVGPFFEADSAPLAALLEAPEQAHEDLLSVEAGLSELPCIVLDRNGAARLRRGQSVILRGRDAPAEGQAYAVCSGVPIASGLVEGGEFVPNRVFNLPF
jgi:tRNA pseudouridine55 synthase